MAAHLGNVDAGLTKRIDRARLLDLGQALQILPKAPQPTRPYEELPPTTNTSPEKDAKP